MKSKIKKSKEIASIRKAGLDALKYLREREDDCLNLSYEKESVENISLLVEHYPKSDKYVLLLVEALVLSRKFDELEVYLQRIKEISNKEHTKYKFEMLYGTKRFQEAFDFISERLEEKRDLHNLYSFGRACAGLKEYEKAIKTYKECIKRFPGKSDEICFELCKSLLYSGKKEEFSEVCRKFIEMSGKNKTIFGLSELLFHVGFYQYALNGILKSLEIKPITDTENPNIDDEYRCVRLNYLTLTYFKLGDEENFIEQLYRLSRALGLPYINDECDKFRPVLFWEYLIFEKNHNEIIKHLASRLEKEPSNPRICALLAFLDKGDLVINGMNSKDLILRAIEGEPGNPVYYHWFYHILSTEKYWDCRIEALEQVFNKAYDIHKDRKGIFIIYSTIDFIESTTVFKIIAEACLDKNDFLKAIDYSKKALEYMDDDYFQCNYPRIAYSLAKLGEIDEAMAIYKNINADKLGWFECNYCSINNYLVDELMRSKRYEDFLSFTRDEKADINIMMKRAHVYYLQGNIKSFKEEVMKWNNVELSDVIV
jgi:tetratricopeptide (TPR) repeat protein